MTQERLTRQQLKELLHYNPDTGDFTWKVDRYRNKLTGKKAGHLSRYGYIEIRVDYSLYRAHRLAFLYMTGKFPKNTDHKNGIRTDNRWANLQAATPSENNMNQRRRSDNKSGFTGVSITNNGKWGARAMINGKYKSLGYYDTHIAACYARHYANIVAGYSSRHGCG